MKIIVFGLGMKYEACKTSFFQEDVVAYTDNNEDMWGKIENGKNIISPEQAIKLEYDAICIVTGNNHEKAIRRQLERLGVNSSIIFNFRDFFSKSNNMYISDREKIKNNEVAFFSSSLRTGGALSVTVCMYLALREINVGVTIISMDGDGRCDLEEMGADLIITPNLTENNKELWELLSNVKSVIMSGLCFSYLISHIVETGKKAIWWLHNGDSLYNAYPLPDEKKYFLKASIFGVSNIVKYAYLKHCPQGKIDLLPYGIPESSVNISRNLRVKRKFIISIIGVVSRIKGVDILIEAIKGMDVCKREELEVRIIGPEYNHEYASFVHACAENCNVIKWLGKKTHDEVIELIVETNVLVSASREDMLPMVVTEAMMNKKVCIVSDAIGTADFITDYMDGIIFESENVSDLQEKIEWCINNQEKLEDIGKNARFLFEKEFSMEIFEKRLLNILR